MRPTKNKYIIVFEGVDGAGKSTQARLLYFALKKKGLSADLYHFPSNGPIGTFVRNLLENNKFDSLNEKSKSLLTTADFYDQYINKSNESDIIIFDRYIHSNFVSNNTLDKEWIRTLHKFAPEPDFVFFLDCEIEIINRRKDCDFGVKNIDRQKDFNLRYKNLFEKIPKIKIDASKNRENIHKEILEIVNNKIKL